MPPSDLRGRFLGLVAKGYAFGTILSALTLAIAISIVAPGDGGASLTGTVIILMPLVITIGAIGLIVFPLAAIASWPFRSLVVSNPVVAGAVVLIVGLLSGAILTAAYFQIGPDDFWSGPLVGLVFAAVWFAIVRQSYLARD